MKSIVLGIDTGGSYTDCVVLDNAAGRVLAKSKTPTTGGKLLDGIERSLLALDFHDWPRLDRVALSTTLATNAVVEGRGQEAGLILIGRRPPGELPARYVEVVRGDLNIKGRETVALDEREVAAAVEALGPKVRALAVSGRLSVRNPAQELQVKSIVRRLSDLPVVCCHELVADLGFYERTVTGLLNARLLPLVDDFLNAAEAALRRLGIEAPLYVIKGDGAMASVAAIRQRPVETVLSGPAASLIGAIYLAGPAARPAGETLIMDMGGTTTDTSLLENGRIRLRRDGASIGSWRVRVPSADILTVGLGGDSRIDLGDDGRLTFGPRRVQPAGLGGTGQLTPTDLLQAAGRINIGDGRRSRRAAEPLAARLGLDVEAFLGLAGQGFAAEVYEKAIAPHRPAPASLIAIGAPAGAWPAEAAALAGLPLTLPAHHEVANAVGAACAEIRTVLCGFVRPGEERRGFVLHLPDERLTFRRLDQAVEHARAALAEGAERRARFQGAAEVEISLDCREVTADGRFVETVLTAVCIGRRM